MRYCKKCGCELLENERIYCIPCADRMSGTIPTLEERIKYYYIKRKYKEMIE